MVQGRHSEMPAHLTPTEKKKIHMTCNYETANPQNTPKFTPKWEKNEYNEISAPSLFRVPHKHTPRETLCALHRHSLWAFLSRWTNHVDLKY